MRVHIVFTIKHHNVIIFIRLLLQCKINNPSSHLIFLERTENNKKIKIPRPVNYIFQIINNN